MGKRPEAGNITLSICGTEDNRVQTSNRAIGRLFTIGTAWISSDGKLVSARHVLDNKLPENPNILEFIVPDSFSDGTIQWGHYQFTFKGVISQSEFSDPQPCEDDWMIFSVYPYYPEQYPQDIMQSYLDIRQDFTAGTTLRVTGYGEATGVLNRTLQTATGPAVSTTQSLLQYKVDTRIGNSGSPVIDEETGCVIGIVTCSGCTSDQSSFNYGTSFYNQAFWNALEGDKRYTTILQRLSDGETSIGKIYWWRPDIQQFTEKTPGEKLPLNLYQYEALRGDQAEYSSQKYFRWQWNNSYGIENHYRFYIDYSLPLVLESRFNPFYIVSSIKNNFLEYTDFNPPNDSIKFKDPWFIDYPDPLYGNNIRNRGTDLAEFHQRASPFSPNNVNIYEYGQKYKGVFLNQDYNLPGRPYYSVKAEAVQETFLAHTGKVHRFYFQGWSADPLGSAEFQYANSTETPVVFRDAGTTVQANLKGTQLTNMLKTQFKAILWSRLFNSS